MDFINYTIIISFILLIKNQTLRFFLVHFGGRSRDCGRTWIGGCRLQLGEIGRNAARQIEKRRKPVAPNAHRRQSGQLWKAAQVDLRRSLCRRPLHLRDGGRIRKRSGRFQVGTQFSGNERGLPRHQ